MIDRFEILASRMRRLVSRNRWSARILGVPLAVGRGGEPGLVLIQVDGLGADMVRKAIDAGRMPFLQRLERDEGCVIHALYTGMPSSTPGFQAELFYGVPTAVPGFGYFDRQLRRVVSMNDPVAAAAVENRLLRRHRGLLRDGAAWSDIFSGDAQESHFCASTAGLDLLLRAINPLRLLALVLWNFWSLVRVTFTVIIEFGVALRDFFTGALAGRDLGAELRFIPARVAVTAVMREVVTAGACIDAERGLPIIQLNLLGYDEHAHRRGPRSRFAAWTLRGIDRSIKRVWLAAHRSKLRDYQVWIYSDHGQEATLPYVRKYHQTVPQAVRRVILEMHPPLPVSAGEEPVHPTPSEAGRSQWFHRDLPRWIRRKGHLPYPAPALRPPVPGHGRPDELTVVSQGPVGFVYFAEEVEIHELRAMAKSLAEKAFIPLVMLDRGDGGVWVYRSDGQELRLPEQASRVFGADHPYLHEVAGDIVDLVQHEHAGELVLMGFDPDQPLSLQLERGAHGGPGPGETSAFVMLPPEVVQVPEKLRPATLRKLALRVLEGVVSEPEEEPPHVRVHTGPGVVVRLMTYNVHGCRGMDGKFSPNRIARVIARQQPDVVCLQELDLQRTRSGSIDQAAAIAQSLQSEFHFHAVAELDDGHFGNAVLSRHPLRLVACGPLPGWKSISRLEDRGVLWVEVDLGRSRLQVLNTHLSILDQERRMQVDALLSEQWLRNPDLQGAVVLCGDFNASMRSRTLRRLETVLRNVGSNRSNGSDPRLHTWSSRLPMRRIDHLFTSDQLRVRSMHVPRNRLTQVASDHLPLVVDLWCPRCERAARRAVTSDA